MRWTLYICIRLEHFGVHVLACGSGSWSAESDFRKAGELLEATTKVVAMAGALIVLDHPFWTKIINVAIILRTYVTTALTRDII